MIGRSKELVEQRYCVANGYTHEAKVILRKKMCISFVIVLLFR